jgi:hypothetical protein
MFTTPKRCAICGLTKKMFSKRHYLEKCCLLLSYKGKPVLESADDIVYNSRKKRNMWFNKKTVFKTGLPYEINIVYF